MMRWPWVSVRVLDEVERQLSYRDAVIERMQSERDNFRDMYMRLSDQMLMGVGAAPVSPVVRADVEKDNAAQKKLADDFAALMAGVDNEAAYCAEEEKELTN